jgi:hypothetical protein
MDSSNRSDRTSVVIGGRKCDTFREVIAAAEEFRGRTVSIDKNERNVGEVSLFRKMSDGLASDG